MAQVDYLSVEELLAIAAGVLPEVAVREIGLLASAAARPQMTVFGKDAYPDLASKAAALLHSLAKNHPLVDGNTRLAWTSMRAMLLLNRCEIVYTVDDAEQMVLAVAAGTLELDGITDWIRSHVR